MMGSISRNLGSISCVTSGKELHLPVLGLLT